MNVVLDDDSVPGPAKEQAPENDPGEVVASPERSFGSLRRPEEGTPAGRARRRAKIT